MAFYNLDEEISSSMHHDVNSRNQEVFAEREHEEVKDRSNDYDIVALLKNPDENLAKSLASIFVAREVEKLLDEIVISYIKDRALETNIRKIVSADTIVKLQKKGFVVEGSLYGGFDVKWSNENALSCVKNHYKLVGLSNRNIIEACTSIIEKLERVFTAEKDIMYKESIKTIARIEHCNQKHYRVVAAQIEEYLSVYGLACDVIFENEVPVATVTWHW